MRTFYIAVKFCHRYDLSPSYIVTELTCHRFDMSPIQLSPIWSVTDLTWSLSQKKQSTTAVKLGIALPRSRDSRVPEIFQSRDWAALNPVISGLTKFIYLTVF